MWAFYEGIYAKSSTISGTKQVIGLIQRVSGASVTIEAKKTAEIGLGLLVLVGIEREDGPEQAERLATKLVAYRIFADDAGKMNRSVRDVGGALLLVPQFTLAADTSGGLRPSFSRAAPPEAGARLFDALVSAVAATGVPNARGRFAADMQVTLTNEGPVTFWLQV
jgi:D-aminoacyl-tRNA deacylase